jgi:hypothetical protein
MRFLRRDLLAGKFSSSTPILRIAMIRRRLRNLIFSHQTALIRLARATLKDEKGVFSGTYRVKPPTGPKPPTTGSLHWISASPRRILKGLLLARLRMGRWCCSPSA